MDQAAENRIWVRLRMNIGKWIHDGISNQVIQDTLDMQVIIAGMKVYDCWKHNHLNFKLFQSWYTTLIYCWGIFKANGHLQDINKETADDCKPYYEEWLIDFEGAKKSGLVRCVMALTMFAEIENHPGDFIVKGANKTLLH